MRVECSPGDGKRYGLEFIPETDEEGTPAEAVGADTHVAHLRSEATRAGRRYGQDSNVLVRCSLTEQLESSSAMTTIILRLFAAKDWPSFRCDSTPLSMAASRSSASSQCTANPAHTPSANAAHRPQGARRGPLGRHRAGCWKHRASRKPRRRLVVLPSDYPCGQRAAHCSRAGPLLQPQSLGQLLPRQPLAAHPQGRELHLLPLAQLPGVVAGGELVYVAL